LELAEEETAEVTHHQKIHLRATTTNNGKTFGRVAAIALTYEPYLSYYKYIS
jgi:hypothetical protein